MKAKFRIDYVGGSPSLDNYELAYDTGNPPGEMAGGSSALEEVALPDQLQVLMLIESSPETIAAMKADPAITWIEDVA